MEKSDLKKLAIDIVDGKVFGSWMLPKTSLNLLASIFMPLAVGAQEHLPEDVHSLYEYYNQSLPMRISGYPTFFSFRYLTKSECDILIPMIEKYQKIRTEFVNEGVNPGNDAAHNGLTEQPGSDQN